MKRLSIILTFGTIIAGSWLLSRGLHMQEQLKPVPASGIHKKITVWIHGTRGAVLLPVGMNARTKAVEKSICTVPMGLHKASEIDPSFHAHTIAQILSNADKAQFNRKDFYAFGWSGHLDAQARKQAAQELYTQLNQLVMNHIVQHAAVPHITLITHSHGGNVALNLAAVAPEDNPLTIDRVILLACPVQQETAGLADAPMFKSIYACHSHNDQIQILDPQGLHPIKEGIKESWQNGSLKPLAQSAKEISQRPLFSERHFASNKVKHVNCTWQTKAPWSEADLNVFGSLKDVVKKWAEWDTNSRGLMHIEFLLPSFLTKLPELLQFADGCQNVPEKNIDHEFSL